MKRISFILLIALFILSFVSCGGGTAQTDQGTDNAHVHSYSDTLSFNSEKHYRMCACGDKQEQRIHYDDVFDGKCDVCGYVMYDTVTVTIKTDEHTEVNKDRFILKKGDELVFTVSVSDGYYLIPTGANIVGEPENGNNNFIYTLEIKSVQSDCEVILSTDILITECTHSWQDATCYSPKICTLCAAVDGEKLDHSGGAASCTEPAICAFCGVSYADPLGHTGGKADCTDPAVCTRCSESYGEALGHVWISPNCTQPGKCGVCGYESTDPIGHTWVDATCTLPQYCSVCFAVGEGARGHSFSAPTCTEPGICSGCGERKGNATGHSWVSADCENPRTCSSCYITEGEALGHSWIAPDCTNDGYCSKCEIVGETAKGHSYSEADCKNPKICSICGDVQGEPLEHVWTDATCTHPKTCSVCGETEGEALGHTWIDATCSSPKICSVCGATEGRPQSHLYTPDVIAPTCTEQGYTRYVCACGHEYTAHFVDPTGHSGGEPTYAEPGYCEVCGTDYIPALGYPITDVRISGSSIANYDIVCDKSNSYSMYCARSLQSILYSNAGFMMSIVSSSQGPAIVIRIVEYAGIEGFRMYVDNGSLIIESSYEKCMGDAMDKLIEDIFESTEKRRIDFNINTSYTQIVGGVRYSDFGAVGDGVTDDFAAIKAAHDYANSIGDKVVAENGKTYNLGKHSESVIVKTDVIWTGATFIIDDSKIGPNDAARGCNVFTLMPDYSSYNVSGISSLKAGQTNVGMTFGSTVLLRLVDSTIKQYIRYGLNGDAGADQQEIILVDRNGNVDPSTPILWDYSSALVVTAYPVDDTPITVLGGEFITIANQAPRAYTYYARGILIKRSNVTMRGQVHYIRGEGDTGAPYNGFLNVTYANNVLFDSIVYTGHKTYKLATNANNSMGTYDISATSANNIKWLNCTQTNSIVDTTYWGVMGSNYCKNLTYDGCILSRFDAHKGTHNATIINSEIGHQKISIIGSGLLLIENTIVHANQLVNLRDDYGSTWNGNIIIRNITLNNTGTATLINAYWNNHYFGYTCYLPKSITIDGVNLKKGTEFYVLPNLSSTVDDMMISGEKNKNPYVLPERISILNSGGYNCIISANSSLFANVEVTIY